MAYNSAVSALLRGWHCYFVFLNYPLAMVRGRIEEVGVMSQAFGDWKAAHTAAVELARLLKRETGIEKAREFGKEVFRVHSLPRAENRCGFELRCEIVRPGDPL